MKDLAVCQPKGLKFSVARPVTLEMPVLNCYQKAKTRHGSITMPTGRKKPWVAEIIGSCSTYGFDRDFLDPLEDKTESLSTRSRDGHRVYHLWPDKIYDIFEHVSFKHEERYLCTVQNGKIVKLTKDEVSGILEKRG